MAPFIYELARLHGSTYKMNRADHYQAIFAQAANDLGDTAIPFTDANKVLGRKRVLHFYQDGREDEIFGYHSLNQAYKSMFTTTFASLKEIEEIYGRHIQQA